MSVQIGISGGKRNVKEIYIGVGGAARKVKTGYVGVDGAFRRFFAALLDPGLKVTPYLELPETPMLYIETASQGALRWTWEGDPLPMDGASGESTTLVFMLSTGQTVNGTLTVTQEAWGSYDKATLIYPFTFTAT